VHYCFFLVGDDWYWQQQYGVISGTFHHEYMRGFCLGRTRVTPPLPWKPWRTTYDVYVKCINGRFVLPITYLVAQLKRKPFIFGTPERDSASLAQALRRILDDRNLREHLAHNARRTITGWDNERMVSGFRQAIDYLINLQRRNA
jgi:hypothetical protein